MAKKSTKEPLNTEEFLFWLSHGGFNLNGGIEALSPRALIIAHYIAQNKESIDFDEKKTLDKTILKGLAEKIEELTMIVNEGFMYMPAPWLTEDYLKFKLADKLGSIKSPDQAGEKDIYVKTDEGYGYSGNATWKDVIEDVKYI